MKFDFCVLLVIFVVHAPSTIIVLASPAVYVDEEKLPGSKLPRHTTGEHKRLRRRPTEHVGHPVWNRCFGIDLSQFGEGRTCGSPFSAPCFDYNAYCMPTDRSTTAPQHSVGGIYVYDYDCSLRDSNELPMEREESDLDWQHLSSFWRLAARDAGLLAETYESACVFIHVNNNMGREEPCAIEAPLWRNGVNHLMVDITDFSRETRPRVADSYAMEAASNVHTCYYRNGYDMSIPLSPKNSFVGLADIAPLDREFFLTVKGSVYLSRHGSEERMSIVPLHDPDNGVVASMHCFELHQEHLEPHNLDYCKDLAARYDDFDYGELMNTIFGIIPAGRSPGTYRLGEVMGAGAIPVFVARDIVRPFCDRFDWPSFSFVFTPDQVGPAMIQTLRDVPPETLQNMQRKSLEVYWEIFNGTTSDYGSIARQVVDELHQRIGHHR